jgi:hypothetical protein
MEKYILFAFSEFDFPRSSSLDVISAHPFQSDHYAAKILTSGKNSAVVETLRKHNYHTMAPPNLHIVELHLYGRRNIFHKIFSVI